MTFPVPIETTPNTAYAETPLQPRNGRRFCQCRTCGGWVDSTDIQQLAEHDLDLPSAELPRAS
jgi:hypothetical protein